MQHPGNFRALTCLAAAALVAGCASDDGSPRTHASTEQMRLMGIIADYHLPPNSVAPLPNPNPDVDSAIRRYAAAATEQGLTVDGSRTDRGILIVGRPGVGGPVVVGIMVVPKAGHIAVEQVSDDSAADRGAGAKMRAALNASVLASGPEAR